MIIHGIIRVPIEEVRSVCQSLASTQVFLSYQHDAESTGTKPIKTTHVHFLIENPYDNVDSFRKYFKKLKLNPDGTSWFTRSNYELLTLTYETKVLYKEFELATYILKGETPESHKIVASSFYTPEKIKERTLNWKHYSKVLNDVIKDTETNSTKTRPTRWEFSQKLGNIADPLFGVKSSTLSIAEWCDTGTNQLLEYTNEEHFTFNTMKDPTKIKPIDLMRFVIQEMRREGFCLFPKSIEEYVSSMYMNREETQDLFQHLVLGRLYSAAEKRNN